MFLSVNNNFLTWVHSMSHFRPSVCNLGGKYRKKKEEIYIYIYIRFFQKSILKRVNEDMDKSWMNIREGTSIDLIGEFC